MARSLGLGTEEKAYSGSLYATKNMEKIDDDFSTVKNNNFNNHPLDIEALKNYTQTADRQGLIPLYDLVLNRVAIDAEIYHQHPEWFIFPSRHFGPYCCDFNYDHSDENIRSDMIKYLKSQIQKYIVEFGFKGVRVDAVKHLPPDVLKDIFTFINQLCLEHHKVEPIIYAEVIAGAGELEDLSNKLQGLGVTHVMNSLYHERFTKDYRQLNPNNQRGYWETSFRGDQDVLKGLWLTRKIAHNNNLVGGTVRFVGSHDYNSLYDKALEDAAKSIVEREHHYRSRIPQFMSKVIQMKKELDGYSIEKQAFFLKEKLAAVAFSSDAGWCLLLGDEFGYRDRKWVFDFYTPCKEGKSFKNKWEGKFDLRPFIKQVNEVLKLLPKPNSNFWLQHVVLEEKPHLMVIVRHNNSGYDEVSDTVIVNLSEQEVLLNRDDIKKIANIASSREKAGSNLKAQAYQCVLNSIENNLFSVGKIKSNNLRLSSQSMNTSQKNEQQTDEGKSPRLN